MKYWRNTNSAKEKEWEGHTRPGKRKLSPLKEFVMTLMRLRLDLPILLIADLFTVSASHVTEITITWIAYLNQTLVPALIVWPSQEQIRSRMPLGFKLGGYGRTRTVIDCTEFYIDRPGNKEEQYRTYSSYKSHNTLKCLIGVNPNGAFNFVSELWSGNVSDKYITEHCNLVGLLTEEDQVMADRGFRIEDLLLNVDATLAAPPFTRSTSNLKGKGKRLNVTEIRKTRTIARLRIHVERAIQVSCSHVIQE